MATKLMACARCGATVEKCDSTKPAAAFCDSCKAARKAERVKRGTLPCAECGVAVELSGVKGLEQLRRGRTFCGPEHRAAWTGRLSSATMARTNRRDASARMRARNPMRHAESRERMRWTLLAIGHRPSVRGGNGRGPAKPQAMLAAALGWPMEVAIPTRRPRGSGYPTAYKADIGNVAARVAIEVDGYSHGVMSRKDQDAKKAECLAGLGWTVLRFSNRDVTERLEACVQTVTSTTSRLKGSTPTSQTAS